MSAAWIARSLKAVSAHVFVCGQADTELKLCQRHHRDRRLVGQAVCHELASMLVRDEHSPSA